MNQPTVLLLGADGFIGRHVAFELRTEGWPVICTARRVRALREMGFEVLKVDLTDPSTHDPEFWRAALPAHTVVVNCAGLLTGSEAAFEAVHHRAPAAVYQVCDEPGVVISAVGIEADTPFGRHRRAGEALAHRHNMTILRPGLVLGDTSYGGSSLLRSLAATPLISPVVAGGDQPFNPVHAADLAKAVVACLKTPPGDGPQDGAWDIGGPQMVSQAEMITQLRGWLGLPQARRLNLPNVVARIAGRVGDFCRFGPISTTALGQLDSGVLAKESGLTEKLGVPMRGFSDFVQSRPAGTQDLWHARLYLLRPPLRLTLVLLWLVSALLGFLTPAATITTLTPGTAMSDWALIALARIGGVIDLAIGIALLRGWRLKLIGWVQIAIVSAYTISLSALGPALWADPLGGILKNLPILMLLVIFLILEEER